MGQVGIGLVGAGQMSSLVIGAIEASGLGRIVSVCDVREDAAVDRALSWKSDRYTTDIEPLLLDPAVDAVVISAPNYLHGAMTVASMRAGKHVLSLRPMALRLAEVDQIINLSRSRELVVGVLEPLQHFAPLLEASAFLEADEIGALQSVHVRVAVGSPDGGWPIEPSSWLWRFQESQSGGGPFLFDGVYEALVASSMLAGPIGQIQAWIAQTEIYLGFAVDAPVTAMWRHQDGACTGGLSLTYSPELHIKSPQYPVDTVLRATGSRGVLEVHLSPGWLTPGAPLVMYRDGRRFEFGDVDGRWDRAFALGCEEFLRTVVEGGGVSCPPELARQHIELTLAARDSSRGNRPAVLGH